MSVAVAPLTGSPAIVAALGELMIEVVAGGGSVSFLHPLDAADAHAFWSGSLAAADRGERVVLGAWDGATLAGTVTLQLDFPPNQRHRAELAKMMVPVRHRGRGIATALCREAERRAIEHGKSLLVLDTASDGGASDLYEKLGFTFAGEIPDFASKPHGGMTGTRLYWKRVGALASGA